MILLHARTTCNADVPPELQRRVLADLDPRARLALFASSPPLARTVLLNTPSDKKLTKLDSSAWPPALTRLLDDPSLLTLADLELNAEGGGGPPPPPPPPVPPPSIAHHVARLHLSSFTLTPASLAAWRLHDPQLWPHLQHLAILACTLSPSPAPAQPLQPIPRLLTFTWEEPERRGGVPNDLASLAAVLPLASRAKQLRAVCRDRDRSRPWAMAPQALASLPHLTHADLDVSGTPEVVEALLRHRTLEHVTLDCLARPQDQWAWRRLSHLPCRWRTLTATRGASMAALSGLPLAHLERLTVCGQLGGAYDDEFVGRDSVQAGLAVLQRLHSQGRLALRKSAAQDQHWRLPPEEGLFALLDLGSQVLPAVLRLVLEAGQGINALLVDAHILLDSGGDLAPLRAQPAHGVNTLCVHLVAHEHFEFWWGDAIPHLPKCITHLKADASHFGHGLHDDGPYEDGIARQSLEDLVVGSDVNPLTRPLTLTLLHSGLIGPELEAELMGLCEGGTEGQGAGGAGGEGREPLQPFVTLRVVRTDQEEA